MKHCFRRSLLLVFVAVLCCGLFSSPALAAAPEAEALPAFGSDEELAALMEELKAEYGDMDVGIALGFTATGEELFYNADDWYVTASLYKLPMLMQIARLDEAGEGERFHHVFHEDFEVVKHDILAHSNNTYSLGLSDLFTARELQDGAAELAGYTPVGEEQNELYRGKYSARMYLGILRELYENEEHYPRLIEYMLDAQPEQYMRHYLEGVYPIAQKYGSVDFYNHIAAIVYAEDPVLVVIMTCGFGASGGEGVIGEIGRRLMAYAETVNARYHAYLAAQEPEPTPEPTPAPTPVPTPTPTATPIHTDAPNLPATDEPLPSEAPGAARPQPWLTALLTGLLLAGPAVSYALLRRKNASDGTGED